MALDKFTIKLLKYEISLVFLKQGWSLKLIFCARLKLCTQSVGPPVTKLGVFHRMGEKNMNRCNCPSVNYIEISLYKGPQFTRLYLWHILPRYKVLWAIFLTGIFENILSVCTWVLTRYLCYMFVSVHCIIQYVLGHNLFTQ